MAEPYVNLAMDVYDGLGFRVAWPINQPLVVGEVGYLEKQVFHHVGNIQDFGIDCKVTTGDGTGLYEYQSKGGVEVTGGLLTPPGIKSVSGNLFLQFKRQSAVFLRVTRAVVSQLDNAATVGARILQMYDAGVWDSAHVVVTEVIASPDATVLVAGSVGATAQLNLSADGLPAGLGGAHAKAGLQGLTGSFALKHVGEQLTPLFRMRGCRKKLFGGARFKSGSDHDVQGKGRPDVYWGVVGFDEGLQGDGG